MKTSLFMGVLALGLSAALPAQAQMTEAEKREAYKEVFGEYPEEADARKAREGTQSEYTREEIREMARKAARERYGRKPQPATPSRAGSNAGAPTGDGHKGIERVLYNSYEKSSGDFIDSQENIYILYRDGMAVLNPNVAVVDLNLALSKSKWPAGWYKWRGRGSGVEFLKIDKGNGQWFQPRGGVKDVAPAQAGTRLSGTYKYVRTSGSMMSGASISRSTYTFKPDGRFWSSSSSFLGSGADMGLGQTVATAECNRRGRSASVGTTNPNAPGGGSFDPSKCGKDNEGEYSIDGYAITLTADSGKVRRLPFYKISDKFVIVGGRWFYKS